MYILISDFFMLNVKTTFSFNITIINLNKLQEWKKYKWKFGIL